MSPQPTAPSRLLQELDGRLGRIAELQSEVATINAPAKAALVRAEELAEKAYEEAKPLHDAIKEERQALAESMKRNRRSLLRRVLKTKAGKVIELPHGVLTMKLVPKSVVLPSDTDGLVQRLLKMRGGKRYLEIKYTPNKKALHAANGRLLKRLGVSVRRSEVYYAQATGEDNRIEIGRRRYPELC